MEFEVVVGNPPYQKNNRSRSRDDSIYHYFYDMSFAISRVTCLITPARFLFNIGSTDSSWNKRILGDSYFRIANYQANSNTIFPETDIKGGLVTTYRDIDKKCGAIYEFIPYEELRSISKKVSKIEEIGVFGDIMYVQNKFNLDRLYADYPEYKNLLGDGGSEKRLISSIFHKLPALFVDNRVNDDYIEIVGRENNKRVTKYVNKAYIKDNGNLKYYKVFVAAANGLGIFGEVLSSPTVGSPGCGHTQTFISLGKFKTKEEADALLMYLKTKFARAMLGINKTTHNNKSKNTWSKVPLQDFTKKSPIDWLKSVKEIDRQLYKKYELTEKEIAFIEMNVKPMW